MQLELTLELNKKDMLTRKNERLQQELSTFKEQCCFYLNERENVMRERDQLVKEYDDLRNYNRELQESRDEAVNKQIAISELLGKEISVFFYFNYWRMLRILISLYNELPFKNNLKRPVGFNFLSDAWIMTTVPFPNTVKIYNLVY